MCIYIYLKENGQLRGKIDKSIITVGSLVFSLSETDILVDKGR